MRASSAAPTYFESAEHDGLEYVDGGLGYNCPVKIGKVITFILIKFMKVGGFDGFGM